MIPLDVFSRKLWKEKTPKKKLHGCFFCGEKYTREEMSLVKYYLDFKVVCKACSDDFNNLGGC